MHGSITRAFGIGRDLPFAHIYAFVETWLDDSKARTFHFPLPDYHHHWLCRPHEQLGVTAGGGISVFVHSSVTYSFLAANTQPESIFLSIGDTLLGLVYNPPFSSNPLRRQCFHTLQDTILTLPPHQHTLLIGDFNAHVGRWQGPNIDIPGTSSQPVHSSHPFLPQRHTRDLTPIDTFGRRLISMAASLSLFPVNGRVPGDQGGAFTRTSTAHTHQRRRTDIDGRLDLFNSDDDSDSDPTHSTTRAPPHSQQNSVIDLALASPSLFPHITSLKVGPTPFSDHCSLTLHLSCPNQPTPTPRPAQRKRTPVVWTPDLVKLYQLQVSGIRPRLSALAASASSPSPRSLTKLTRAYSSLLRRCKEKAVSLLRTSGLRPLQPGSLSAAEWWTQDLQSLRQHVNHLHHLLSRDGGDSTQYQQLRRQYKQRLKQKKRAYLQHRDALLRRQLRLNPHSFWKWWSGSTPPATITPDAFIDHLQQVLAPPPTLHSTPPCPHPQPAAPTQHSPALDSPFSVSEVATAIYLLRNGRASADGFQAELLRWARDSDPEIPKLVGNFLKEDLTSILNTVFLGQSAIPKDWLKSYVTPVYKNKGDPLSPSSHRPITVTGVLYKLYAIVLLQRLQNFLEQGGVRAPTQLGFRPHKGTDLAIWLLNHCITSTCSLRTHGGQQAPLYTCFVDIKAAFDSAHRPNIWARLQEAGIGDGNMLRALQSLYSHTELGARVQGQRSSRTFTTTRGVKQGCPLSPLLFGLLMDKIHSHLQQHCPRIGVPLYNSSALINHIMYADDIVLMARTPAELQQLLGSVEDCCSSLGLQINTDKSVVMLFPQLRAPRSTPSSPLPPLHITVQGTPLQQVTEFSYLGIIFTSDKWITTAGKARSDSATRQIRSLWAKATSQHVVCRDTLLRIYRTQILPIGTYGAGIWGVHHLHSPLSSPLQHAQNIFLRLICAAYPSTSIAVMSRNVGLPSIDVPLFQAASRIWCTLKQDPQLLLPALISDIQLAFHGCKHAWAYKLFKATIACGLRHGPDRTLHTWPSLTSLGPTAASSLSITSIAVTLALTDKHQAEWDTNAGITLRDTEATTTASIARFQTYVYTANNMKHMTLFASPHLVDTLFRFRSGSAGLNCSNRGPHRTRHCTLCPLHVVEDELHFVQECPAYCGIRAEPHFAPLFRILQESGIKAFFAATDQHMLARCLSVMLRVRQDKLLSAQL